MPIKFGKQLLHTLGRRLISETRCNSQLELCEVGRQQVTIMFDGENVVSDAGLHPIAELDQRLWILAEAARQLRDKNRGQPFG